MNRLGGATTAIVLLIAAASCSAEKKEERPKDENASLGGEIAVRVGDRTIPLSVVASVARVQKITPHEAARLVTDDEIAASAARSRGLDRARPTSWNLIAARARWVSERLSEEARAKGPPTDDEVKELSEKHWLEVDRPPMIKVVHAVVLRPEKNPELTPQAKELASKLREAVLTATDEADFEKKAKEVANTNPIPKKLEVRVEHLPAFSDEGWATEGGRMNKVFTTSSFAIASIDDTSGIIETPFGWHVVRLVERIPEKRMPFETRRIAFVEEVNTLRARALYEERINALRGSTPIAISPAAAQLTEMVTQRPEAAAAAAAAPK